MINDGEVVDAEEVSMLDLSSALSLNRQSISNPPYQRRTSARSDSGSNSRSKIDQGYLYEEHPSPTGELDANRGTSRDSYFHSFLTEQLEKKTKGPVRVFRRRISYGSFSMFCEAFILLLVGIKADYGYSWSFYMNRKTTGIKIPTLIYLHVASLLVCAIIGGRMWLKQNFQSSRSVNYFLCFCCLSVVWGVWLSIALFFDYGKAPYIDNSQYNHLNSSELSLYFFLVIFVFASNVMTPFYILKVFRAKKALPISNSSYTDLTKSQRDLEAVYPSGSGFGSPIKTASPINVHTAASYSGDIGYNHQYPHDDVGTDHAPSARVLTEQNSKTASDLDYYWENRLQSASGISKEEFKIRWKSMPESGQFSRQVPFHVPTIDVIRNHLECRGFILVMHEDVFMNVGGNKTLLYFFAQEGGVSFLMQLSFENATNPCLLTGTFKCQIESKAKDFVRKFEFNKLLESPEEIYVST